LIIVRQFPMPKTEAKGWEKSWAQKNPCRGKFLWILQ